MMTEEQILELAKTFGIGVNKYKICICWEEEILKFARAMYEKGREDESELYVDENY
jgi:hypothetical protein